MANPTENEFRIPGIRKWTLGFGVVFLTLGVLTIVSGLLAQNRTFETQSWPYAAGTVKSLTTGSKIVGSDGLSQTSPISKVSYTYSVYGQKFVGNRHRVVPMLHSSSDSEKWLADYREGSRVLVFYNPLDPKDALLVPQPGKSAKNMILILVFGGSFSILVGLILVCTTETAIFGKLITKNKSQTEVIPETPPMIEPVVSALKYQIPWPKRKPKPKLHWGLRAMAIFGGAVVALFGIFLVVASYTVTTSIEFGGGITTGLMLLMIASGVYMIWLGITRNGKQFAANEA